ncbi:hypothetical protein DV735_g5202, partial [Chaetothyriales sp. CBS 134920]
MSTVQPPKALLTDVFGTVVDWRGTVVKHLTNSAKKALEAPPPASSSDAVAVVAVREAAAQVSWADFAQRWRVTYYHFTQSYDPDKGPFKSVDEHHLDSLIELVNEYNIQGLWTDDQLKEISLIWHALDPWPDSAPGLRALNDKFITATLSNGNTTLLADLARHGNLEYTHLISAEDFKAYKPHPTVYLGAAEKLGLAPSQCAMVAAHLGDLEAARGCGYQTIYIDRPQEGDLDQDRNKAARQWVDMWIDIDQPGFKEVARRFGLLGSST